MNENLYVYQATALRVNDGDTYTLRVDCGFRIHLDMEIRLLGIDTPEVKRYSGRYKFEEEIPIGKRIGQWVSNRILNKPLFVKTQKDDTDNYGRMLAEVFYQENGEWVNLTERMLELGYDKKSIQEKLESSTTIEIPV